MNDKHRVLKIDSDTIYFDGIFLTSEHESDCCESHYLSMADLTIEDFEELEFNLSNDQFFNKIDGYGIELVPVKGFPIRIPGYGFNNGYYSTELVLVLDDGKGNTRKFDITECQVIDG